MYTFKIKPDDGDEFVVTAGTRDVLAWERAGKGRSVSQLMVSGLTMSAVYELAFLTAKRHGKFNGTQTEFEVSVDIELGEDEAPDPTRTDR